MKKDIADLWVAALRSGAYKQGSGVLRSKDDKYCCLGVLCDLSIDVGIGFWKLGTCKDFHLFTCSEEGVAGYGCFTQEVQDWAGMESDTGRVGDTSLMTLNDDGASFDQIADIIEERWEKL